MIMNLVNKTKFAKLAGVSVAAVTKATKRGKLQDAMHGTKVDASHPAAVAYIDTRYNREDMAENGIDPLYDKVVEFCQLRNIWSWSGIARGVPGMRTPSRAKKVFAMIKAAGLIPAEFVPQKKAAAPAPAPYVEPEPEPYRQPPSPRPTARPSGRAALKADMKQAPRGDLPENLWELIPADIRRLGDMSLKDLVDIFGTDTRFKDWLDSVKKIEDIHEKRVKNASAESELIHVDLIKRGILDPVDTLARELLTDAATTMSRRLKSKFKGGMTVEEAERYISGEITKYLKPMKDKIAVTLRDL